MMATMTPERVEGLKGLSVELIKQELSGYWIGLILSTHVPIVKPSVICQFDDFLLEMDWSCISKTLGQVGY